MKEKKATTKKVIVESADIQNVEAVSEQKVEKATKSAEEKAAKATKKAATVKEEAKKIEKKATDKKETKKATADKKEAKKTTADKKVAKKAAKKIETKVLFQYSGNEIEPDTLLEQAKAQYIAAGGEEKDIREITLYIKPEDNAAYYVVNGIPAGKVVLFV